jgi:hypothetical protein
MNIYELIKFYKHGYSKVTDHSVRETIFGRITMEEGKKSSSHMRITEKGI